MKNAVAFLALILALGAATGTQSAKDSDSRKSGTSQFIAPTGLKTGDLVFRKGKGFISTMFGMTSTAPEQFSHVGMVAVEHDGIFVYHMLGNAIPSQGGCKRESLESFCDPLQNSAISFYRIPLLQDYEPTLLHRLQVIYKSKTPFDEKFELSDNGPLYCSELIYNLVKESGHITLPLSYHRQIPYVALDNLYHNSFAIKLTDIHYSKNQ